MTNTLTTSDILLDERIAEDLRTRYERMMATGKLLTPEMIANYLDRFRSKFGPEALSGLDGVNLLETMHGRQSKDSLAYWLEFKKDEEFPTTRFGSIAGGAPRGSIGCRAGRGGGRERERID